MLLQDAIRQDDGFSDAHACTYLGVCSNADVRTDLSGRVDGGRRVHKDVANDLGSSYAQFLGTLLSVQTQVVAVGVECSSKMNPNQYH